MRLCRRRYCTARAVANGLCRPHYIRSYRRDNPRPDTIAGLRRLLEHVNAEIMRLTDLLASHGAGTGVADGRADSIVARADGAGSAPGGSGGPSADLRTRAKTDNEIGGANDGAGFDGILTRIKA